MSLLSIINNYKWTTAILSLAVLGGGGIAYITKEEETKRNRVYTNEELLKIAEQKTHTKTLETAGYIKRKILKDELGVTTNVSVTSKGDAVAESTSPLSLPWKTVVEFNNVHINNVMLHKELRRVFPEMVIEIDNKPYEMHSWISKVHCSIPDKEKEKSMQ